MNPDEAPAEPCVETRLEELALDLVDAETARRTIRDAMQDASGLERVQAALSRWTWRMLIERRLDVDLRTWHRLLLDTAATIANASVDAAPTGRSRRPADPATIAERVRGLADLVRLSIQAAEASTPDEFEERSHVIETMRCLSRGTDAGMDRDRIREGTGSDGCGMSRTLTLMAANGLVERMPRITTPTYRPTSAGLKLIEHREERA